MKVSIKTGAPVVHSDRSYSAGLDNGVGIPISSTTLTARLKTRRKYFFSEIFHFTAS
jgi:hypothetical protein